MKTYKFYFAYGVNLNQGHMKSQCRDMIPVEKCILTDYKLVFNLVGTIRPEKGGTVLGAVYKISEDDEIALDSFENYPQLYSKQNVTVIGDKKEYDCMVYIMRHQSGINPPGEYYLKAISEGYKHWGLPIERLNEAAKVSRFNDENKGLWLKK